MTGDNNGNIYLIDWVSNEVQVIEHFEHCIEFVQYDMADTFMFYISFTGIMQWKYPFRENHPKFTSIGMIEKACGSIHIEFAFNQFCYIWRKKLYAVNIKKIKDSQTINCLGILNSELTEIINFGICIKNKNLNSYRIFWSNDCEYLALLNYFENKENNVHVVKFNGLKVIESFYIDKPACAWFIDSNNIMVSSYYKGVYILFF